MPSNIMFCACVSAPFLLFLSYSKWHLIYGIFLFAWYFGANWFFCSCAFLC
jgi:hypothetical protein